MSACCIRTRFGPKYSFCKSRSFRVMPSSSEPGCGIFEVEIFASVNQEKKLIHSCPVRDQSVSSVLSQGLPAAAFSHVYKGCESSFSRIGKTMRIRLAFFTSPRKQYKESTIRWMIDALHIVDE